jgi:hypothetical protein
VINRNDINTAIDLVANVRGLITARNPEWQPEQVELEIPLVLQALRCETADDMLHKHILGE